MQKINEIGNAINYKQWNKVKDAASSLNRSSGLIGASHIHYDSYFM